MKTLLFFSLIPVISFSAKAKITASFCSDTTIVVREARLPEKPKKALTGLASGNSLSSFRLLAIGGGLTSGFRDGGLYREGQQWAYPNLLARQLGISFKQPLFSKSKGNGTGYTAFTPTGKLEVTNALALLDDGNHLESFVGTEFDNYALPFFGKRMDRSNPLQSQSHRFIKRLDKASSDGQPDKTQWEWLSLLPFDSDLFIFEVGFDDLIKSIATDGPGVSQFSFENLENTDDMKMIGKLVAQGKKGLLLTVPDVLSLPYYQQYSWDTLKKTPVRLQVMRSTSSQPTDFDPKTDLLLPCETARRIVNKELTGTVLLKDEEFISAEPYDNEVLLANPGTFNRMKIERAAKRYDLAIADLYTLYKKILTGTYRTHDDVRVDPTWPSGNFFSSDGLYPSSLGQAIIANECIHALNKHYGFSIPFIPTKNIINTL